MRNQICLALASILLIQLATRATELTLTVPPSQVSTGTTPFFNGTLVGPNGPILVELSPQAIQQTAILS